MSPATVIAMLRAINALEPGQSLSFGRAWDDSAYVRNERTTPGQWLGGVSRTIAYGATFDEAWAAPQEETR